MGHVDHGKTTLLDKIRNTTIAAREAGGITQHIGASEVPIDVVKKICGKMMPPNIEIPGLLFIDTPGHEAFTNLRRRGGNASDLAILVVDINKGFEPQTVEAVEILKEFKTPFVVAANKVDVITGWRDSHSKSITEAIKMQSDFVVEALNEKLYGLIGKLSEFEFTSEEFSKVKDFQKELAIIPISAKTGEGIAELLMLVSGLSQKFLEMKLKVEVNGPGRGSILEKREVKGLGVTIDIILYDGSLHINDTIAFATQTSVATAKIKALLKPKPLHEIRESQSKFYHVDSVSAASGVKISGTGLDDALPGSPVIQVLNNDYAEEINSEIRDIFKTDKKGIILKADSIGSIEAISMLLKDGSIDISKKGLGNVTKRDVLDAFGMQAANPLESVILAFNVATEQEASETAINSNVKIIEGNIIYKLIDDYKLFAEQMRKNTIKRIEEELVFPGMIEVLPNSCFRVSHPAIFGVNVNVGRIMPGYLLMNASGEVIGKIKGIQNENSPVDAAKKGDSVAISIDEITFGRQVKENDILYTRVRDNDEMLFNRKFGDMLNDEEKALLKQISEIKKLGKNKQ
jgi:translation initiation factor 5B